MRKTIDERTTEILRDMGARCNCGGPQCGTDHSPDCEWELAGLDAYEQAQDEEYQRQTEVEA